MFPEPSLIAYGPASDFQIIIELIALGLTLLLLRFALKPNRKTAESGETDIDYCPKHAHLGRSHDLSPSAE